MASDHSSENRERLHAAVQETQAAARELLKDAASLSQQSTVLQARAAQARADAESSRIQAQQLRANLPSDPLLTIPEAARHLHVSERILRRVLSEPILHARLIERTRKVGIYYKFLPLLPPDLVADLTVHFAEKNG